MWNDKNTVKEEKKFEPEVEPNETRKFQKIDKKEDHQNDTATMQKPLTPMNLKIG
ncbi:hypothetical protein CEXT_226521, partial [Caerostris extrusa]